MGTRRGIVGRSNVFRYGPMGMLIALLLLSSAMPASAAGPFGKGHFSGSLVVVHRDSITGGGAQRELSRALAAGLALTLGPFGAHRIYFGTEPKVPLLYGLTFGGFGVLVLIDLGHILFSKDLTRFSENERVLMWAEPRDPAVTPP